MTQTVVESHKRLNITATNTQLSAGKLIGIFVSQASAAPTLKVADGKARLPIPSRPVLGFFTHSHVNTLAV